MNVFKDPIAAGSDRSLCGVIRTRTASRDWYEICIAIAPFRDFTYPLSLGDLLA